MKETIYDKIIHYMSMFCTGFLVLMICLILIAYKDSICRKHGMEYNVLVGCVNE